VTPTILVWSAFRCHVLLPHDCVGSIIDGQPTWPGLTVEGGIFRRNGKPVLLVDSHIGPKRTRVVVTALEDVWLQEPGLVVKIAGEGTWRGFDDTGTWTSRPYSLKQKDAHRSTVHFSRIKTNPFYTEGVEYCEGAVAYRFHSDGGFAKLLNMPPGKVPWEGCQVFGRDYELAGVVENPNEVLHRWELAGKPPNIGQMYFLGWTGGAGCVVNEEGRDVGAPGNRFLWQPRSWRRLGKGQHITQTLWMRRLER
jgi:hypothetical protein